MNCQEFLQKILKNTETRMAKYEKRHQENAERLKSKLEYCLKHNMKASEVSRAEACRLDYSSGKAEFFREFSLVIKNRLEFIEPLSYIEKNELGLFERVNLSLTRSLLQLATKPWRMTENEREGWTAGLEESSDMLEKEYEKAISRAPCK